LNVFYETGLRGFFNCPQTPELNFIELVFNKIKKELRNRILKEM